MMGLAVWVLVEAFRMCSTLKSLCADSGIYRWFLGAFNVQTFTLLFFFLNDRPPPEISPLPLPAALPTYLGRQTPPPLADEPEPVGPLALLEDPGTGREAGHPRPARQVVQLRRAHAGQERLARQHVAQIGRAHV